MFHLVKHHKYLLSKWHEVGKPYVHNPKHFTDIAENQL